jgi:transposase
VKPHSGSRRRAGRSVVRRPDGRIWIAFRKELRWPPPRGSSSAFESASATPAGTYLITLHFAEVDGRLECVHFEFGTPLDAPNGPVPAPVTASALRGVPLGRLIDQTLLEQTKALRRWAREAGPIGREADHLRDRVAAAEASLGRGPGRPPEYSEDHFRLVADAYTRSWKIGRPPTQAVAAQHHVSHSTAAKWVARAREMGFLPPTKRGRSRGGQPSDETATVKPGPPPRGSRKLQAIDRMEQWEAMQLQVLQRHEEWLAEVTGRARPADPRRAAGKKSKGVVRGGTTRRALPPRKR